MPVPRWKTSPVWTSTELCHCITRAAEAFSTQYMKPQISMVDVSLLQVPLELKREIKLSLYHPSLLSAPPAPQDRDQLSCSLSHKAQGPLENIPSWTSQNALLSPGTGRGVQLEVLRGLKEVHFQPPDVDWMLSKVEILIRAPPFYPYTRNPLEIVL